jgi:hypothetical protein
MEIHKKWTPSRMLSVQLLARVGVVGGRRRIDARARQRRRGRHRVLRSHPEPATQCSRISYSGADKTFGRFFYTETIHILSEYKYC